MVAPRQAAIPALALAAALAVVAGCRGERDPDPGRTMPEPIGAAAAERAHAACDDYIAAVCACADSRPEDPELLRLCAMAPAKRSGIEMLLELNRTTAAADERLKSADTLRRYESSCIEGKVALGPMGCALAVPTQ